MGRFIGTALLLLLLLTGCGKADPPEYQVGDASLPALEALADLPAACSIASREQPDTGSRVYTYTGLSVGGRTVCAYVRALSKDWSCTVIDADNAPALLPDFNSETGCILVGKNSPDGLLRLELCWTQGSCTVLTEFLPDQKIQEPVSTMMTVDQAVHFLQSLPPAALELAGSSMEDYTILAEDAMVMVNNRMCYCLNLYDAATHAICGTRLVAANGRSFYRLDRDSGQVSELIHPRIYQQDYASRHL